MLYPMSLSGPNARKAPPDSKGRSLYVRMAESRVGFGMVRLRELFPITWLGLLVGGASWFALSEWAYGQLDIVLLVIGYGALALSSASLFCVGVALLRVLWDLRRAPGRMDADVADVMAETGRYWETGHSVPGLVLFPLVQIHSRWLEPEGWLQPILRRWRYHERASVARRGRYERTVRAIVVSDAFGLARVTIRRTHRASLMVLPHVGGLRRVDLLPSFSGGDEWPHPLGLDEGDRVELRRYTPGDPARFIHWKVFGRTRKLMVRVPERALSRARRTAAYLISGIGDSASAAAARVAVEQDALGPDWIFGADGVATPASDVTGALGAICVSGGADIRPASGLASFVEECERKGPASIVVFAPAVEGPWIPELLRLSGSRPGRVRVVIGVDGLERRPTIPMWRRWVLGQAASAKGPDFRLTEGVAASLASAGVDVVVVDRPSGRRLGKAHLRGASRASRGGRAA